MSTLPISVMFVHGTWASGSAWPLLEAGIRRAFGGEQVAVQYLNWSGRNTVSARLSAAENLAHLLKVDHQHRPTARRFIIAHSHGGAVALLGMRDAALRQAVAGIICLSTPFLLVRQRSFSELGSSVAILGFVSTWVLVVAGVALKMHSILPLLLGAVLAGPATWVIKCWARRARSFMDRVSLPSVSNLPLLIVRAPDDEASLSLGLMQAANRVVWLAWSVLGLRWVAILWNAMLRLADRVKARRILQRGAEVWIIALIISFFAIRLLQDATQQDVPSPITVLLVPVLVVCFTIFVAALMIIPTFLINALALLPFGPEFSIFSPFIEVSAESTPSGDCRVVQLTWECQPTIAEKVATRPPAGEGWLVRLTFNVLGLWSQITTSVVHLQHSKTYSDTRAIATVVNWMQDQVPSPCGREFHSSEPSTD